MAQGTRRPGPSTIAAHFADEHRAFHGAVIPPIYQNSLFVFESYEHAENVFEEVGPGYVYTRGLNPTVEVAEKKIAALEGGEAAKCFGSGMAAISSTILSGVRQGSHVVCVESVYPVTYRFLRDYMPKLGVDTTFVDGDSLDDFYRAIKSNTSVIYLETPSSMLFRIQDLRAIASLARDHGIMTIIDNSWASPIFQNPLSFGIDVVVHSATKYLSGHSHVVAGVAVGSRDRIDRIIKEEHAMFGGIIGPFEAWLLTVGLRTLAVRMERHSKSALEVATFLESHPKVAKVNYPGLKSSPYHALASKQMTGYSGLMSVVLNTDKAGMRKFVDSLKYFLIGVSWGGFESLVFPPVVGVQRHVSAEVRERMGITDNLVRLHIGLEDVADLIDDLDQALALV